jgi:hypothetical protein
MPMVIRGGVVGDAFSAPSAASDAPQPQAAAQEPASSKNAAKPEPEPTAPQPSTPRPAENALKPE